MPKFWLRAAAICLCSSTAYSAAHAQTDGLTKKPTVSSSTKVAKTPHHVTKPAAPVSGPAANLNAPSTDFSTVEPETGEPRERRQRGPNVRPGLDSNGRPVMGLGF